MLNVCASIAYDGSKFRGFAPQPHKQTVIDCYLLWLKQHLNDPELRLLYASRTDAGVHAFDHKVQIQTKSKVPIEKWKLLLNRPEIPIRLNSVLEVAGDWGISKAVWNKQYGYLLRYSEPYPVYEAYSLFIKEPSLEFLSEHLIQRMQLFVGEHDFYHFCKLDKSRPKLQTIRSIRSISFHQHDRGSAFVMIEGSGFLWQMVRYIVAYGLEIYFKRVDENEVKEKLKWGNQIKKGSLPPVPSKGLYLMKSASLDIQ